jgi:hypothetical protein
MADEQAKILLSSGSDEARLLLDTKEYVLYRRIQNRLVELVREYDVQLPLNCLQFFYHVNGYSRKPDRRSR